MFIYYFLLGNIKHKISNLVYRLFKSERWHTV